MPSQAPFEYPPSLQKYMVTEAQFFAQNPAYHKLCSGAAIFDDKGRLLLVQRAKDEQAFPNFWVRSPSSATAIWGALTNFKMQEIPGGKVDDTDETILHAVVREVKEETGLDVARFVRLVGAFGWEDFHERRQRHEVWHKLIFEVETRALDVVLDPVEHQAHLFATEDEVACDCAVGTALRWISPPNKELNLAAFRQRRPAALADTERDHGFHEGQRASY